MVPGRTSRSERTIVCVRIDGPLDRRFGGSGCTDERLPQRLWKHVVEVKMKLADEADTRPAGAVDRDHRLKPDLEIAPHIDRSRIDGASGGGRVAEIVGDR